MDLEQPESNAAAGAVLVPVTIGGSVVLLSVEETPPIAAARGEEHEIAFREPKIEQVLDGVAVFAREVVERLRGTQASKITVEFGCQVAMESGGFLAVIGKASATSTFKVGLEWSEPGP